MPSRLLLFSPAIGVSRLAAMSTLVALRAPAPGLETAAWLDVFPEFDPYKYSSFPVHAAHEVCRLTTALEDALGRDVPNGEVGVLLLPCAQFGQVRSNPFEPQRRRITEKIR